jgi:hypothetical protein
MNRTQIRVLAWLPCLFLALGSCATVKYGPKLYDASLRYELVLDRTQVRSGESIPALHRLRNLSEADIGACIAEGKFYTFLKADGSRKVDWHLIDHPGCVTRFTVEAKSVFEWASPITIPEIEPGTIALEAEVQVVDPTDCYKYGCASAVLAAPLIHLEVLAKAS